MHARSQLGRPLRSWVGALLFLASWWCAVAATAAASHHSPPLVSQTAPNKVTITSGGGAATGDALADLLRGRTYVPKDPVNDDGSRLLRDLLKGPGPKGPGTVDVEVTRVLPWKSIAKGIGRSLPIISTAIAIQDILDDLRCRGWEGQWQCDDGQNTLTFSCWQPVAGGYTSPKCYPTAERAMTGLVQELNDAGVGDVAGGCNAVDTIWTSVEPRGSQTATYKELTVRGIRYMNVCPSGVSTSEISSNGWTQVNGAKPPVVACPAYTNSSGTTVPAGEAPDRDGKCDTGNMTSKSADDVANKTEQHGDKTKAGGAVGDLDRGGIGMDLDETAPPSITGPGSVPGVTTTSTTQKPDGSTTTTTTTTDYPFTYIPGGYEWTERTTSNSSDGTTTTTGSSGTPGTGNSGSGTGTKIETCGLPWTPPCKIDEAGTPPPDTKNPAADAQEALSEWSTCLLSPSTCFPALPSLNWTFTLPTSCGVIDIAAFAPYLTGIDICQFQPMFHDLMSVAWIAAGLLGALGLVFRDATGGN